MLDDLGDRGPARHATPSCAAFSGCFLFSEDDVFKQIGVLSGGERNRYALARMLHACPRISCCSTSPPTTWTCAPRMCCSTRSQEFTGTVVFVSHDRYFIDKLATRVFEVEDGRVHGFPGNYEDYLWRKRRRRVAVPGDGGTVPREQRGCRRRQPRRFRERRRRQAA